MYYIEQARNNNNVSGFFHIKQIIFKTLLYFKVAPRSVILLRYYSFFRLFIKTLLNDGTYENLVIPFIFTIFVKVWPLHSLTHSRFRV